MHESIFNAIILTFKIIKFINISSQLSGVWEGVWVVVEGVVVREAGRAVGVRSLAGARGS